MHIPGTNAESILTRTHYAYYASRLCVGTSGTRYGDMFVQDDRSSLNRAARGQALNWFTTRLECCPMQLPSLHVSTLHTQLYYYTVLYIICIILYITSLYSIYSQSANCSLLTDYYSLMDCPRCQDTHRFSLLSPSSRLIRLKLTE